MTTDIKLKTAELKHKYPAVNNAIVDYAAAVLMALKSVQAKQTPTQLQGFLKKRMSEMAGNSKNCPRISGKVIEFVAGLCIVLGHKPGQTWTSRQASALLIAALESEQELSS